MNFQLELLKNFSLIYKAIFFLLLAFSCFLLIFPIFFKMFKKRHCYQYPSSYTPENHQLKKNIPNLGGLIILCNIFLISLFFLNWTPEIFSIFFGLLIFGILGFYDDYLKFKFKNNKSIVLSQKLVVLIGLSFIVAFFLIQIKFYHSNLESKESLFPIYIPFFKNEILNFDFFSFIFKIPYFEIKIYISLALLFYTLVILCTTIAVNFTDGLDGLVSGCLIFSFLSLSFFSYYKNQNEVFLILFILIGTLLGFLVFNKYPAKIFMGDSGALSLGAGLGVISILLHKELSLLYIGIVFVLEFSSVCIQILSYKLYKKPFFKMAPIHHHYEKSGYPETKIVAYFWILQIFMMFISLFELI